MLGLASKSIKGVLSIDNLEDLPDEAELEKNDLKALGVKSMIAVTLRNKNQTIGVIGFQMFGSLPPEWTAQMPIC